MRVFCLPASIYCMISLLMYLLVSSQEFFFILWHWNCYIIISNNKFLIKIWTSKDLVFSLARENSADYVAPELLQQVGSSMAEYSFIQSTLFSTLTFILPLPIYKCTWCPSTTLSLAPNQFFHFILSVSSISSQIANVSSRFQHILSSISQQTLLVSVVVFSSH